VLCFDTLLQVLILKELRAHELATVLGFHAIQETGAPGGKSKNASKNAGVNGQLCAILPTFTVREK
jgi:hypothetical protein